MQGVRLGVRERQTIALGLVGGEYFSDIAPRMQRPTSTISREVNRCGGRSTYRSSSAQRISKRCGRRPKVRKLASNPVLAGFVEEGLKKWWPPAEIHARLVLEYPDDEAMRVSYETIYSS